MKWQRWASLMVVIAALIGLAVYVAAPSAQAVEEDTFSVGGQQALLIQPDHPTDRLVVYVHGASGSAKAIKEDPVRPLTDALVGHGFAVVASDAHGPQNWGNRPSVRDYVRLADRLGFRRIFLLAQSMGGLDGVQLIDRLHPEAWAGIYPVCNAESAYVNPLLTSYVEQAWHGPPPHYLSPVKATDTAGLNVLIWASPKDKLVPFGANAATCARQMRDGGAHVRLVRTKGEHGDPSNFHPARLVRFFEMAAASGPAANRD